MSHDYSSVLDVEAVLRASVAEVSMTTAVDEIVADGRRRRRRRRTLGVAAGVAVIAGVGVAVGYGGASTSPTTHATAAGGVHIRNVAFTVDSQPNGAVRVTWSKQRYFQDHDALQAALRKAGMPVIIQVGEFCAGPRDDTKLDASGVGPGVDRVMKGQPNPSGNPGAAVFVFTPSAMPTGKQLFIGYLNPSQLAVTHGHPGSVERLVSTGVSLTCTTTPPQLHG
jgi:hypothetical protein